jgi:hypothetical protein
VKELPPETSSIIVTTELAKPLVSECLTAGTTLALICYTERFRRRQTENNEFIFLVDCSSSMHGDRILYPSNFLKIFIRLRPENMIFNSIRLWSASQVLFDRVTRSSNESIECEEGEEDEEEDEDE